MFTELNNILSFEQGNTPAGKLISIFQDFRSDSSYLIHHFLSYFLRAGDTVCLVGLTQSFGHYNNVGQKLGLNLKTLKDNGKLFFFEGLRICGNSLIAEEQQNVDDEVEITDYEKLFDGVAQGRPDDSVRAMTAYLSRKIKQFINDGACKVHIIFDDISVLLALGIQHKAIFVLIHYLQSLLIGHGNLVVRGLMDEDEEDDHLSKYLCHYSHVTLATHGLASGYCKDVHGQIDIKVREPSSGHPQNLISTHRQYKIEDKNVRFFASGTSAAVL